MSRCFSVLGIQMFMEQRTLRTLTILRGNFLKMLFDVFLDDCVLCFHLVHLQFSSSFAKFSVGIALKCILVVTPCSTDVN